MSGKTMEFTDANFQADVLESDLPVMVDFWAPWCAPCRMLTPTVEQIAKDYEGRLKVGKLNVDDNFQTAGTFNIRGVPTLLVFKNGAVVDQIVGASPRESIVRMIDKHI